MEKILGYDALKDSSKEMISRNSLKSFFAIREVLNEKEKIEMELYDTTKNIEKYIIDNEELNSKFLEYETIKAKITGIPKFTRYYGSIRGTIVTIHLHKSIYDNKPNIKVIDLTTDRQVKCFYDDSLL